MQQTAKQSRIPEQQGIGQTLPPVPVGIDALNAPPLPPGAMPAGTRLQVGKYQVIVHNFIAEGGFAHVYIARIEGKSGYVVLKRVAVPDGERLKMVEKEIAFMRRLGDHKNIVRYYESRIDALPVGGFEALILMEYCPGGGVIDLMNRRLQQRLTEPEILKIFSDVAEALAYMHYCNPPVLHRDLKVENILILNQDHYKLCDFGSASLSKGGYIPTTLRDVQKLEDDIQRHTTLQYRAPEMIDVYQKKPVNEKADIWAMGVLLYKLCYYTTPFEEEGQLAILNARYNIPNSPIFSDGLRHLIVSMLQEDQNRRPNIYQVMNAVCRLRGIDCPIRDIYSEPIITPPYGQQQPYQQFQQSPSTTNGSSDSGSIFEKVPSPPQELPNITPMRRGRPTKPERTSAAASPVVENRTPTKTFDPFDPSHVNKNTSPTSPSASSTANATPPTSFQNSFIPEPSSSTTFKKPSTASTSSSFKKTPVTSTSSSFKKTPVTSTSSSFKKTPVTSTSSSLKNNSTTSSDSFKSHRATSATSSPSPSHVQSVPVTHHMALKPQMATKILQTQPNSPANAEERPKKQAESNLDNDGDDKDNGDNDNNDEGNKDMPKINRGVSSSIEARFMAIKNASRNSNHSVKPTPTVSSNAKKNKPAPPPKPARFRSQQIPSVDDFENKFPSLEDLDKSII